MNAREDIAREAERLRATDRGVSWWLHFVRNRLISCARALISGTRAEARRELLELAAAALLAVESFDAEAQRRDRRRAS